MNDATTTTQQGDAEAAKVAGRKERAERQSERRRAQFGKNLVAAMEQREITGAALAARTGLSVSYVSMLRSGTREASLHTTFLLGDALGKSFEELWGLPKRKAAEAAQ